MELGAFWVSLSVRDLQASQRFYETLGFTRSMGDPAQGWLIVRNEAHVIGLFRACSSGTC